MIWLALCMHLASQEPTPKYVYLQNLDQWVDMISGDFLLLGKLDAQGNFHVQRRFIRGSARSRVPTSTVINGQTHGKKIYEFRSGRLVIGEIVDDGRFIPDLDSKIIDIKDYKYDPKGIQIYNLPGFFVPTDKK
jgi:hypothetical protein